MGNGFFRARLHVGAEVRGLLQLAAQSRANRQGRGSVLEGEEAESVLRLLREDSSRGYDHYQWMLNEGPDGEPADEGRAGLARELARMNLTANVYSQWYWKIDLHNLLHFLSLRVDPRAQWEIQQFGRVIAGMIKRVAPLSYEAWVDYDLGSEPLTRVERHLISSLLEGNEDGLQALDGAKVTADEMKAAGLSSREITELMEKLSAPSIPDFELDVSQMVDADAMARKMYQAVPSSFE